MYSKPNIGKAVLTSVLAVVVFYVVYTLAALLLGLLFALISAIPILGTIMGWLFEARGDTPGLLSMVLGVACAYISTMYITERLTKNEPTMYLSRKIVGLCLVVLNVIFFIANAFLLSGGSWGANLLLIIAGVIIFLQSRN